MAPREQSAYRQSRPIGRKSHNARVVVWLTEAGIWGRDEPVFCGCRGPLTAMGIFKIVERYRNPKPARQRSLERV